VLVVDPDVVVLVVEPVLAVVLVVDPVFAVVLLVDPVLVVVVPVPAVVLVVVDAEVDVDVGSVAATTDQTSPVGSEALAVNVKVVVQKRAGPPAGWSTAPLGVTQATPTVYVPRGRTNVPSGALAVACPSTLNRSKLATGGLTTSPVVCAVAMAVWAAVYGLWLVS
jgi:hypothetical protein